MKKELLSETFAVTADLANTASKTIVVCMTVAFVLKTFGIVTIEKKGAK